MITDKIADMITRIRNGYMARKPSVDIPHSNLLEEIARVMQEESYIESFTVEKSDENKKTLSVTLKYIDSLPVAHNLKRISKPGLRIYKHAKELHPILSDMGISILSTSKGIMTNKQAKKRNIGGEVLIELW